MLQIEDHVTLDVGEGEEYGVIVVVCNGLFQVKLEESGKHHYVAESALTLACPFDGSEVDSDHRACPKCKEII